MAKVQSKHNSPKILPGPLIILIIPQNLDITINSSHNNTYDILCSPLKIKKLLEGL
jgi:hypothetical protein